MRRRLPEPRLSDSNAKVAEVCWRSSDGILREFLALIAKEFDRRLCIVVGGMSAKLNHCLEGLEKGFFLLEKGVTALLHQVSQRHKAAMTEARRIADAEREEKALLAQWLNSFLEASSQPPKLSAMDLTFGRFALNVSMAAPESPPSSLLSSGVPAFLCGLLESHNELVAGPAAMALAQISHHDECKAAVARGGGIRSLAQLCRTSLAAPALTCACSALALLGCLPSNKSIMAAQGALSSLVKLASEFRQLPHVTSRVVGEALAAIVNATCSCDANRSLAIQCAALPQYLKVVAEEAQDEYTLTQAARSVANCAYGSSHRALSLLSADADMWLADLIASCDLSRHSDVSEACFVAMGNLCTDEASQHRIASGPCLDQAVKALSHCSSAQVVRAAASCIGAICFSSNPGMAKASRAGAIPPLLRVACNRGMEPAADISCDGGPTAAEMALLALAQLLEYPYGAVLFRELGGMSSVAELAMTTEDTGTLIASAKVLVAVLPSASHLERLRRDGEGQEFEETILPALERCQDWAYAGGIAVPAWLGDNVLARSSEELLGDGGDVPPRLLERRDFNFDLTTDIPSDAMSSDSWHQSSLFRLY